MKNIFTKIALSTIMGFAMVSTLAQNVSVNMLVLNSGVIPTGGTGTLQATINATTGTGGQSTAVPAGRLNLQISVPSTLNISATQSNLPNGWTVRNNNGSVLNLCNNTGTIAVGAAVDLLITLEGVTATTGTPIIVGQLTFRTNCSAPGGALPGDNSADNSSTAGFTVAGTVPVKLTNFAAVLNNCKPTLSWKTEREIGFDRFEIEKAGHDASNWLTIGAVNASGNLNSKNSYSFDDRDATVTSDKLFYRLKLIDKDGRYSYSPVLPLNANCRTSNIQVFPNPIKGNQFYISINTPNTQQAEAILFSATGQAVAQTRLTNGTNNFIINQLAAGVYLLKISYLNGESKLTKLLVER